MKIVSLIILALYLLQPLACFAHPCDSFLNSPNAVETLDESGNQSSSQDADRCDSTLCCGECICQNSGITVSYAPLVSVIVTSERHQILPNIVIPIFVPPQNIS